MNRSHRSDWPSGGWKKFEELECFEFNEDLDDDLDDGDCEHCRHYLTNRCKKLNEFLEELG